MDINEAIVHALRGQSVLFTGAGFSYQATNVLPSPLNEVPTAREFAKRLASLVGSTESYDLPVISQFFIKQKGEHGLLTELINTFSITSVKPHHLEIAKVPWRRVYTTNYDNCFEFASLQSGETWTPLTLEAGPSGASNRCVHINGHISNLTIDSLSSQVKLTHSSYSSDPFAHSKWSQQFRQDLNNAKSIFFVGYSLADIDITRILYSSPDLRDRTFFVVGPTDDEIVIFPLEDYGTVHPIGVEELARQVAFTEVPLDVSSYEYSWLEKYDSAVEPVQPDDKAGIDLLTMGVVETPHVVWSLGNPEPDILVRRSEIDEILLEISRGRHWFLIHSDLGNGKTVLKQQLSHILTRQGYTVFWDSEFELNRSADLRNLSTEQEKVAVFIDESPERFEVIDGLLTLDIKNILVFVCVRTTLFELGEARYENYLPHDYIPLDINRLSDVDVTALVHILNKLGLWGERAADGDVDKENFVKVECGRSIAKLILSIFRSSEIGARLRASADHVINTKGDISALVILSFVFNRIGHPPRLTVLSEIIDKDVWRIVRSEEFQAAGEFIRFSAGIVKVRSPIFSTFLLRYALKPELLVWHLEKFVRRLASLKRDSILHHIFTEMQRFPVIESLIETPRKRELIIGYFQSLKDLSFCQKNALFWLHYAMARLSFGEFQDSTLYFEHARALAKGSVKDTIDVNNHYARLLIDSRIYSDDYDDYFDAFLMAHSILIEQMVRNTNRHFPFRQAKKYVEFISFRGNRLTKAQVLRFITCCTQVAKSIEHLDGSISRSREVRECADAMRRAIVIARSDSDINGSSAGN